MIEVALEIEGQAVGSGMFDVLPRKGESVHVRIHAGEESRAITGRVIDVQHGASVTIDDDGNLVQASSMVTLVLRVDATVEPLKSPHES